LTELHNLYETAIRIIDNAAASGMTAETMENMSVSAILTDKGSIFTGINGTRLENGVPAKTCSEYEAITTMMMSGENRIIGIVTVAFKNRMISIPCEKCRSLITNINPQNITCGIMTDENTAVSLHMLSNQKLEDKNNAVSNAGEWQTDGQFWGNDDEPEIPVMNNNFQNPPIMNGYNNNRNMMNNNNFYNGGNMGMNMNNSFYGGNVMNGGYNVNMGMNNGFYNGNDMGMNGYYNVNGNMGINNGFYNNMGGYNGNIPNNQPMNSSYYQQNNPYPVQNQNPYDYVQPVPPSNINTVNSGYSVPNVSGNIYVHSSVNTSNNLNSSLSQNTVSNNTDETQSENNIYKQKLKDLLKTDISPETEENAEEKILSDKEMKKIAKLDAKEAKKIAKANKKANKKGFFDQFL